MRDETIGRTKNLSTNRTGLSRRTFLQYSAVAGGGILIGIASRGRHALDSAASAATPDATATRAAELDELHALQTQVANPPVCTPAATSTPEPTPTQVPPAQTGQPLAYMEIWTITVLGISPTVNPDGVTPAGKLMQVSLTASHTDATAKLPPVLDFRLVDSKGRFSVVDIALNQSKFGSDWGLSVNPGVTATIPMVFDVAADAGDSFILESKADPTFRVAMTVEQRG
jgi:hypothetical protein